MSRASGRRAVALLALGVLLWEHGRRGSEKKHERGGEARHRPTHHPVHDRAPEAAFLPFVPHALADELTTWADTNDTRWLVAPARSLVPREPPAPYDAIVAWKVVRQDSVTILQPGWVSSEMPAPLAAAVVNDVIFAVSRGAPPSSPAVLYALDGATGKELWNSGTTIPTGVRAGLSAGGSQVYLATGDGTLYAFGFPMEH